MGCWYWYSVRFGPKQQRAIGSMEHPGITAARRAAWPKRAGQIVFRPFALVTFIWARK
jgi:hypothetical protein